MSASKYNLTAPQTAMLLRMFNRKTRDEFTPTGSRSEALSAANWYRSNDALEKAGLATSHNAGGARRSILTEAGIAEAERLVSEGQKSPEMALRDAVVAHFLETNDAADVSKLAERLGWSASKVRKVINDNHGSVPGVRAREEHRASYSKSFPGMQQGSHKAWVYEPTLEHMRELLLAARRADRSQWTAGDWCHNLLEEATLGQAEEHFSRAVRDMAREVGLGKHGVPERFRAEVVEYLTVATGFTPGS